MNAWIVLILAGVGSYLLRLSMIALPDRGRPPGFLDRAARLVAPAAFAALAMTAIVAATLGRPAGAATAPLAAVAVAVLAVLRTRSPHAAVLAGMPTLWLVSALGGA